MATKLKIKKGATVQVIAGADKGKKGVVLEIAAAKLAVRVQGVRMQTHYVKQEGLSKREGLIHYSNLKLVDGPAPAKAAKKTKAPAAKKA